MIDFDIQRCTRKCANTGRELQPGESFYSVLEQKGADIVRRDYCEEGWPGPPEESLGWWKSKMPDASAGKMRWAPNDVMLHYFEQLEAQPEMSDVRYILALLMVRRRILQLDKTETNEAGQEFLVLFCQRNETEYKVPVAHPSKSRINEIQDELARILYAGE